MKLNLTNPLVLLIFAAAILTGLSGCRMWEDSGYWRGTAVSRDEFRESYSCNVETDITHTDTQVIIDKIATDCGAYRSSWRPGTFDLHGTSLWKNGRMVGWAREDGSVTIDVDNPDAVFTERYPYSASRVVISWTTGVENLEYNEEAYLGSRVQRTHGWLRRDL